MKMGNGDWLGSVTGGGESADVARNSKVKEAKFFLFFSTINKK